MGGSDRCYFLFNAVATVYGLTASNNDVQLVELELYIIALSFSEDKQSRPRLLVLANFNTCLSPEIPCDIAFIPSILRRLQRWWVS